MPSWADACRRADREYRERQARLASKSKDVHRLAVSTIRAVNYLLKQNDRKALRDFIASHSREEAQLIIAHVKRRTCPVVR